MIVEIVSAAAFVVPSVPAAQADDITLSARLVGGEINVGSEYTIEISLELGDGWTTTEAGIPSPLLQLDVPPSVTLAGKVLETYRELSRNEFLNAPFERQFEGDRGVVKFTLTGEPNGQGDGETGTTHTAQTIGINLVAYAKHEDGRVRFIRRRVDLPLIADASASSDVRSNDSSWGHDMGLEMGQEMGLQIGDKATPFKLPRADGSMVDLADYLGNSNIIVTTYRAFW